MILGKIYLHEYMTSVSSQGVAWQGANDGKSKQNLDKHHSLCDITEEYATYCQGVDKFFMLDGNCGNKPQKWLILIVTYLLKI